MRLSRLSPALALIVVMAGCTSPGPERQFSRITPTPPPTLATAAQPAGTGTPGTPRTVVPVGTGWEDKQYLWWLMVGAPLCGPEMKLRPGNANPVQGPPLDVCVFTVTGQNLGGFYAKLESPGPLDDTYGYDRKGERYLGELFFGDAVKPGDSQTQTLVFSVPTGTRITRVVIGKETVTT